MTGESCSIREEDASVPIFMMEQVADETKAESRSFIRRLVYGLDKPA